MLPVQIARVPLGAQDITPVGADTNNDAMFIDILIAVDRISRPVGAAPGSTPVGVAQPARASAAHAVNNRFISISCFGRGKPSAFVVSVELHLVLASLILVVCGFYLDGR